MMIDIATIVKKLRRHGLFIRTWAFLSLGLFGLTLSLQGQDLPRVIPPSPEAGSIVGFGNTGVNFYTGAPSISIPIYSVESWGYSLPINLTYSGSGGIKIESLSSWVGLGWTLNAGGVVTRTIRGFADNEPNGYWNVDQSGIPNLTNATIPDYQAYADGLRDGEPDVFHFNANGMSGSFSIDKTGRVVLKTKSDIQVIPIFQNANEVSGFTIVDTSGNRYTFDEQEQTSSRTFGTSNASMPVTSAWYLTRIENAFGQELMTFQYQAFNDLSHVTQFPISEKYNNLPFNINADMKYAWQFTDAKRISSIDFPHGSVHFIASATARADYLNDRYLEKIEIRDEEGGVFRAFTLSHSYFDNNRISPITEGVTSGTFFTQNVGDFHKRLKLDAIQEWGAGELESLPPHEFTYDQGHFLPSRYSFASDHWGYYNGQTTNNSPEPVYKLLSSSLLDEQQLNVFGTANKEPSEAHTRAGVLRQIKYPTGGTTTFEYELNEVVEAGLPNQITHQSINIALDGITQYPFSISLINDPFSVVDFRGYNDEDCDIQVSLYNDSGVFLRHINLPFGNQNILTNLGQEYLIPDDYRVSAALTGCSVSPTDTDLEMIWENETALTNKPVGGLRLQSIIDDDGLEPSTNQVIRDFTYNYQNGESSGGIQNVPQYGYQRVFNLSLIPGVPALRGAGFARTIKTTYPLLLTNGSPVGYRQVTVQKRSTTAAGKTVYHYSGPSQPARRDFFDGFYDTSLSGETLMITSGLNSIETYPFPRVDDRELVRGLLEKQVDYRQVNGQFYKAREVEYTFAQTFEMPFDNGEGIISLANVPGSVADNLTFDFVEGIIHEPGSHQFYKKYRIYSGRIDKVSTKETLYDLNDTTRSITSQTNHFYQDLSTGPGYFTLSKTSTTDSDGSVYETENDRVFDETGPVYEGMVAKNIVSTITETRQLKNGILTSTNRTEFDSLGSSGNYAPRSVLTAKANDALETRLVYHHYQATNGNLQEVSKDGGPKRLYIYGYHDQLPVAEVINADSVTDIAYTSFEQDATGGFTYNPNLVEDGTSPTGAKHQSLSNGPILKNLDDSQAYIISYYLKDGTGLPSLNSVIRTDSVAGLAGWTYYEHVISGTSLMILNGSSSQIDELRLYPVGAQMTTYTYDPLLGITSRGATDHQVTRYVYDAFGRLHLVKDLFGNIVSANEYEYQVSPDND